MKDVLAATSIVVLLAGAPYVARIVRGPTVFDRVVGLNGLGTKVAVLLVLSGALFARIEMMVDLALGLFLLNLVTTLLIARHVRARGRP